MLRPSSLAPARRAGRVGVALMLLTASLQAQAPTPTSRISALVTAGDRAAAYRLADSLLAATLVGDTLYAEVLYWRAFSSANAAAAERDYLRLAVEFPLSTRAEDALLLLAQLESARGDRAGALRHLERLEREHPNGRTAGRGAFWRARLAFDGGDTARGCSALSDAMARVPREDVETRNQMEYFAPRCVVRAAPDSATAPAPSAETRPATGGFSVQVAAFNKKVDAQTLARRLKQRGFDVRVSGTAKPFRVRIGRYATRAEAEAALGRMRKSHLTGRVVEAEPG